MAKKKQELSILPDNRPALKGDSCLNCGTPLNQQENFCHHCGQRNDQRRLNFWDVFSESFKSYFSVDNRAVHSLIPLFTKPGKLTREYIEGKRQQYVHPIRMYLTVSIVYFTLISLSNLIGRPDLGLIKLNDSDNNTEVKVSGPGIIISSDTIDSEPISEASTPQLATPMNFAEIADSIETISSEDSLALVRLQRQQDSIASSITGLDIESIKTRESRWDTVANDGPYKRPLGYYLESETPLDRMNSFIKDQDSIEVNTALDFLQLKNNRWNRFLYTELKKGRSLEWQDFLNFFVGKLPIILFLFLPIFALSFWVVYIRRDYYYIEHLIFLFHVQTVFFLLLIIEWLFNFTWPNVEISPLIVFTFIIYSYLSMRRFYKQGWFKTFIKWALVNVGFFTFGLIFFIIAFGIVFLAY